MILTIILLPLLGSIFSGLLGRYVGRFGSVYISIYCMILVSTISIILFLQLCFLREWYYFKIGCWFATELFIVNWGFLFDSITLSMLFMISIVSTIVHIYSSYYMYEDPHLSRFMSYLSLFTFFMFILISSDNFIQLFLGWEGVGICSYLLINFWFTRIQANKSALKALIMNRIGDFGLLIGILLIFYFFRSVDFAIIFVLVPYFVGVNFMVLGISFKILSAISLFLFIGSMGKSAQIGLHTWLPEAMEGPTPVSALIHAATMVTAGVFLLIRCSPLFEYASDILIIITIIGSLTAFISATIGVVQNDIKKIIAYSTCSQLGYMIFSCGISAYDISFFHLINHAFFKALLFLASGIIIHGLNNEQDMRKMGGLVRLLPYSYSMMLIGSLSLAGFPFLSGFYSKDLILEVVSCKFTTYEVLAFILGLISAYFTAFYSGRLLFLTFGGQINSFYKISKLIHEGNYILCVPLLILVFGAIFSGYFLKDIFVGFGSIFFSNSIVILDVHYLHFDIEFLPLEIKLLPSLWSFLGFILAGIFYFKRSILLFNTFINRFYIFLNLRWFFDHVYNQYFGFFILWFSYEVSYKIIDKGFLEYVGPTGISKLVKKQSNFTLGNQSGLLYQYIFIFLISWFYIIFFLEISLN